MEGISISTLTKSSSDDTAPDKQSDPKPPSSLKLFDFSLTDQKDDVPEKADDFGESSKFECPFCQRVFANSQNAHKRERQRARRAQFHSQQRVIGESAPVLSSHFSRSMPPAFTKGLTSNGTAKFVPQPCPCYFPSRPPLLPSAP